MKKLKLIIYLSVIISFCSCTSEKIRKVDMGQYIIDVPYNWKKIDVKGIDSETHAILTSSGDTITRTVRIYKRNG